MNTFNYERKYHYLIKYIVIGFPVLLLLLSNISYNNSFENILDIVNNALISFRNLPINIWYNTLLDTINLNSDIALNQVLLTYPLYVFWVYVLDIILDIFTFIPKLAHKFIYKWGLK